MNLLDYTKKLKEKINLYDSLTKNKYTTNPFALPITVTIVWVEDKD